LRIADRSTVDSDKQEYIAGSAIARASGAEFLRSRSLVFITDALGGDRKLTGWKSVLAMAFQLLFFRRLRSNLIVPRRKCGAWHLFYRAHWRSAGALKFDANYLRDLGLTARMSSVDGARSRSAELTPAILLPLIKSIDLPTCLEIYNICAFDLLTKMAQTADRGNRL